MVCKGLAWLPSIISVPLPPKAKGQIDTCLQAGRRGRGLSEQEILMPLDLHSHVLTSHHTPNDTTIALIVANDPPTSGLKLQDEGPLCPDPRHQKVGVLPPHTTPLGSIIQSFKQANTLEQGLRT